MEQRLYSLILICFLMRSLALFLIAVYFVCSSIELLIVYFFKLVIFSVSLALNTSYYLVYGFLYCLWPLVTNTFFFSTCYWTLYSIWLPVAFFFSTCFWTFRHLLVGFFTFLYLTFSYFATIEEYAGFLTRYCIEYLLDVQMLTDSLPVDKTVGTVIVGVLIYGLVWALHRIYRFPPLTLIKRTVRCTNSPNNKDAVKAGADTGRNKSWNRHTGKRLRELKQQMLCILCLDRERDIVFKPCQHLCACNKCASKLNECPVCRGRVKTKQKIYNA